MNKREPLNVVVTGSSSGLGKLIVDELSGRNFNVFGYDWDQYEDVVQPDRLFFDTLEQFGGADILINCAGVNLIGYLEDFTEADWDKVVDTNAKGIFMMTKAALPDLIKNKGTVLNIVSNASHMPMTGSLAYNASKGAAHIMTLQLARELTRRHGITVFGISPNKLAGTGMSKSIEEQVVKTRGWTAEYARQYQINSLITGEETDPKKLAEFIAYLLSEKDNHKYLSGCVLPYGA
jgi:NAD(P)-dependent dehydrogenase (short-subunit alcohol dehydrogenase family)